MLRNVSKSFLTKVSLQHETSKVLFVDSKQCMVDKIAIDNLSSFEMASQPGNDDKHFISTYLKSFNAPY